MLGFTRGDAAEGHHDVTEQVRVNMSTNTRETATVAQQSCIGDWATCNALNQSALGHFNTSDSEAYGPPGLEYVTAVASNYTLAQTVILGLLAGSTSLVTISGNLVVILSFMLERSIRQPSNYFIASLAVSDLLIGSISMPFYTVYLLSGKKWPLGPMLCDLWLSLDYTVCLCSIYTVFCITIDRFCSVQIPAKYRNWRTERKVVTVICVTWVFPVLVFFTSIIGWQYFVGARTVPDDMCYVQYMEDAIFNFLLQFGYFWITLTVMCSLYVGIYRVALRLQRQAEAKHQRRTAMLMTTTTEGVTAKTGVETSHYPQQQTTIAVAVDQHNSGDQQPNGGNAVSGGGGQKSVEADNNIAEVPLPASSSPKSNKKNKHHKHQGKHPKKHSHHNHDSDDQSSSFAFSSDSEHNEVNYRRGSKAAAGRTAVGVAKKRSTTATSEKASKKTRRRVTRHASPVVAVECAVQFIAEQRRTTDDISRPDTELRNVCDSSTAHACTHDKYQPSLDAVDAVHGSSSFAVETPVSRCQLDHQCVFEAWRRPRPRLSPVWVRRHLGGLRRHLGGPCRQRGECDDPGRSASASHVVVVEDHDGPATCGCNSFPSTLANVNCVSAVHSPDVAAGGTADARWPTETTKAGSTGWRKWRGSRRRSSGAREPRLRPFAIVAALRRFSQTRRQQRGGDNAAPAGSTTTAPQPGKTENRARKALRTITIILGAFVLCWTPWHVLSMIMGFCLPCVEPVIYDISYWLCYLNSPINPFCYAFANQQFKKTFLRIIRGDWHRT